jgi:hypothetical protein
LLPRPADSSRAALIAIECVGIDAEAACGTLRRAETGASLTLNGTAVQQVLDPHDTG